MFEILQPFEVRDSHTTSVAENIGKETDSFTEQNLFSSSGSGTIGSLNDEFALEFISIISVDGLFVGGRDENIAKL